MCLHDIAAGALNFRDVMLAYGKLSRDMMAHGKGGDYIGLEFSGKVNCKTEQAPKSLQCPKNASKLPHSVSDKWQNLNHSQC